jgi:hypothetical protein
MAKNIFNIIFGASIGVEMGSIGVFRGLLLVLKYDKQLSVNLK